MSQHKKKDYPATVLDLREVCAGKRVFLTSDPHGCFDEFIQGLYDSGYNEGIDILVIAGDLGDRGPKIKQIFQFVMNTPNVFALRGNHDWKLERYLMQRPVQARSLEATIKQLELNHAIPEVAQANQEMYLEFLESLPHLIRITDTDWAVHAGIHPYKGMDEQSSQFCMYGGRFDPETNQYGRDTGHTWYQFYEGKDRIFFGHLVHQHAYPEHAAQRNVVSLDGGCVFGGLQRICLLEEDRSLKILEIPAAKVYFGRLVEGAN